jgi:hypothetical protein
MLQSFENIWVNFGILNVKFERLESNLNAIQFFLKLKIRFKSLGIIFYFEEIPNMYLLNGIG